MSEIDSGEILEDIEQIISSEILLDEKLEQICIYLKENVPHYDWVGFYLVEEENDEELVLGPFAGEPTEHTHIGFGEGICGQAADREENFVVQDVSKEDNYLSCSVDVKSEIVVPIFKDEKVVGEIDIDSHEIEPFTEKDEELLERIAEMAAEIL